MKNQISTKIGFNDYKLTILKLQIQNFPMAQSSSKLQETFSRIRVL